MSIGLNITKLMEEKNVRKIDLSRYLKVARNTLNDYLEERTFMTTDTLEKLAKFFNVSVGYFFNEENTSPCASINASNHSVALGNHSVAGNISLIDCQKELEHLRKILEEKERTIQILMNK
jgi:transcriptional regulator with XRE-family HTH domain